MATSKSSKFVLLDGNGVFRQAGDAAAILAFFQQLQGAPLVPMRAREVYDAEAVGSKPCSSKSGPSKRKRTLHTLPSIRLIRHLSNLIVKALNSEGKVDKSQLLGLTSAVSKMIRMLKDKDGKLMIHGVSAIDETVDNTRDAVDKRYTLMPSSVTVTVDKIDEISGILGRKIESKDISGKELFAGINEVGETVGQTVIKMIENGVIRSRRGVENDYSVVHRDGQALVEIHFTEKNTAAAPESSDGDSEAEEAPKPKRRRRIVRPKVSSVKPEVDPSVAAKAAAAKAAATAREALNAQSDSDDESSDDESSDDDEA